MEHYDAARSWVAQWQAAAGPDLELEWQTVNNRQLGRNPLPVAAARQYQTLTGKIRQRFPALDDWCRCKPLTVLAQQSE